jgi:hypothetical protein
MPVWLVAAARKIAQEYGGDAGAIWANRPNAADLAFRLRAFPGISQKKSAMAVEILARDFGVAIDQMAKSDVAYDVHVRRVFYVRGSRTEMTSTTWSTQPADCTRHDQASSTSQRG